MGDVPQSFPAITRRYGISLQLIAAFCLAIIADDKRLREGDDHYRRDRPDHCRRFGIRLPGLVAGDSGLMHGGSQPSQIPPRTAATRTAVASPRSRGKSSQPSHRSAVIAITAA